MRSLTPFASWRPRGVLGAAVALRHERPNAAHRARYYAHRWPDRAGRDLFEIAGGWTALWVAVALLGILSTVTAVVAGDEATLAGWSNIGILTLLLLAHVCNAARVRRRRSLLLVPVLAAALASGILHMSGRLDTPWVDILTLALIAWIPIAAADVLAPRGTYLPSREHGHG